MKQAIFLFAAVAAAHVTPKVTASDQVFLSVNDEENKNGILSTAQEWWETIFKGDYLLSAQGKLSDGIARIMSEAQPPIPFIDNLEDESGDDDDNNGDDGDNDDDDDDDHHGKHGRHGRHGRHGHHGHHGDKTKTIWELISESKYTKRFAAIVEDFDDIKAILQDTKANYTLFVPTDRAFERLPDHDKPPAEAIRAALEYTIAPGLWPKRRLFFSQTVPTELKLDSLGGYPQRLRVDASLLFGLHVNLYSKVVAADIAAKNGLIHAVDHILVPPPRQAKIVQLVPSVFSTFSLALEQTGLADDLADLPPWHGGTFFVPTNRAFARLGPRANAFLFSDRGKRILKALLKYTIVANETLYTDAFYKKSAHHHDGDHDHDHDHDDDAASMAADSWHVDLPSLLHEVPIGVDVRHWKGFVSVVVNGYTRVAGPNFIAEDGVLHIINNVLIPPKKKRHHGGGWEVADDEDREVSVEELVERLEPYVDEGSAGEQDVGDL